jgi:hypothetical protein
MIQLAPDDNIFIPDDNISSQMITLAPGDKIASQMITIAPDDNIESHLELMLSSWTKCYHLG